MRTVPFDFAASVVVFLVAVPLSMGIALASGAPIVSGLIAAAIGGIVVGSLGGAPLQVSGPAAGLAVLVYELIAKHGWPALGMIVLAAGLLQVALGLARVARVALVISPSVVHGMLAGIGFLIALAQLHVLLGGKPQSNAFENLRELPSQIVSLHGAASILGVCTLAILVAWPLLPWKAARVVPAALVGVAAATIAGVALRLDVPRVELPSDLASAIHFPTLPTNIGAFVIAAITMAFVASAESLLCAVATDKMHEGPRARLDKELFAQGVANTLSGLVGGLPITGVIVRSTANVSAGAKTRLSAILHGVWVVLALTLLASLLSMVPLSALAALLVLVGVRLLNPRQIKELKAHRELSTFAVTFLGVVFVNLLAGIVLGFLWSAIRLLRGRSRVKVISEARGDRYHVTVTGPLTFLGVPKLTGVLAAIPERKHVTVSLDVEMIDHGGFEALHAWRQGYERLGGTVQIKLTHKGSNAASPRIRATFAAQEQGAAG